MSDDVLDHLNENLAKEWCELRGDGWLVLSRLGEGATASVYEIDTPDGLRSLKVYSRDFSTGKHREVGIRRIAQQVALRGHDCPSLVQVYEGGEFKDRLYLLMSRAPGKELEKCLKDIPREKIRNIVDQVARAVLFLESKGHCHRDIKTANVFISDDYSQATLLDISVIRDIYDPIGIGTDQDGQLPVVATTRYTPPEYLFRLLNAGPELWHALNIYQLGALLHDLIMKEPLFESEHARSKENRYRFAWIVAMNVPSIQADDVDKDLIFTAQRALDKDWKRRSSMRVEDFLAETEIVNKHALALVGFTTEKEIAAQSSLVADRLQRIRDISHRLEDDVLQYLRKYKVTAIHRLLPGTKDTSKIIRFSWEAQTTEAGSISKIEFQLTVDLRSDSGLYSFSVTPTLSITANGVRKEAGLDLPEFPDEQGIESILASQSQAALTKLASDIMRATADDEGV